MRIELTKGYVMTSDAHNLILNESSVTKSGRVRLRPVGYYSDVSGLVDGLISLKVRHSKVRSLKGLIQEQHALIEEIRRLFR